MWIETTPNSRKWMLNDFNVQSLVQKESKMPLKTIRNGPKSPGGSYSFLKTIHCMLLKYLDNELQFRQYVIRGTGRTIKRFTKSCELLLQNMKTHQHA